MGTDASAPQAKSEVVGIRVTAEEMNLLKALAALRQTSVAELVRMHGLSGAIERAEAARTAATAESA